MGNICSIQSAFEFLGASVQVSSDPARVSKAHALILPGVGSFHKAMQALTTTSLDLAMKEAVLAKQRPILGICLGMQLLAEVGTEDGLTPGLGFIPGTVIRFKQEELGGKRIPHIGFNSVKAFPHSRLFDGLPLQCDFYFVHSYCLPLTELAGQSVICNYGKNFLAAFEKGNLFGTQFHPEKSQTNGLKILQNFMAVSKC
jgi:glutamine amidotransferase